MGPGVSGAFLLSLSLPLLSRAAASSRGHLTPCPSWARWPFCGRAELSAVSHSVERCNPSGRPVGHERGHLHYKLAMMKPLLTIMGSFQSVVMPATADNACHGPRSRQPAITQALPSATGSSSHAHRKVHFPAQLGTLPRDKCLFAFNLLQAEEAQRKHSITGKNVFISVLLEGP